MIDSKKLYYALIALLVLLGIGMLASVDTVDGLLASHAKSLVSLKAKDLATNEQQTQLIKDKADIAAYSELNTIAKSVVPQDKDQAEAVLEIVNLAAQSGIPQLSSITFPPSSLGTGTSTTGNLTQVSAVKGIPGVYELQITVSQNDTQEVPYSSFISFLSKLEQNRRTAQVSSINIEPDQKTPNMISFTLVIDEFIKP